MLEVGRVVMKIAGRDARQVGIVVEAPKDGKVLVDGQLRRRHVNVAHVEPLKQTTQISAGADSATVAKALDTLGYVVPESKNAHGAATRQTKQRATKKKAE